MKKVLLTGIVMLVAGVFAMSGCSRKTEDSGAGKAGNAGQSSLQIKGSDTMVNLGQAWAEAFMNVNPHVGIAVTGGGSGTGIAALINGTTDIAESSRSIKPEEIAQAKEKGINPVEKIVGYDGIAVVVHPDNPVSSLTTEQLAGIFSGKITDWGEIGGSGGKIVVLSREVNSGTHVYFKEHVLNNGDSKGSVEYTQGALLIPSSQGIADEVAQNTAAIGYYGMGYISDKQKALKIMADAGAEAMEPTVENVMAGKYPVSRPLFMYTNGEAEGTVKQFIDFVLSDAGQSIVEKLDFVPVK